MDLNLLPGNPPWLGVALDPAPADRLRARLEWAAEQGFDAVELPAHGGAEGFHSPDLDGTVRAELAARLVRFSAFALTAPHQETFDVSLVSPSAAIRRASLSEIWSACRLAGALAKPGCPRPVVLLRTGLPPMGNGGREADTHLRECLEALGHTAAQNGITLGILSRDRFRRIADLNDLVAAGLPHVGIALDLRYLHEMGESSENLIHAIALCRARLIYAVLPAVPRLAAELAPALRENGVPHVTLAAESGTDLIPARDAWLSALHAAPRE